MKIAEPVTYKTLQDKVVAVDTKTGAYYTMNETASFLWNRLAAGEETEEGLLQALKSEYPDVDEATLSADLQEQLNEWKQENLIV